jgi:hypothetical protein
MSQAAEQSYLMVIVMTQDTKTARRDVFDSISDGQRNPVNMGNQSHTQEEDRFFGEDNLQGM